MTKRSSIEHGRVHAHVFMAYYGVRVCVHAYMHACVHACVSDSQQSALGTLLLDLLSHDFPTDFVVLIAF